MGSVTTRDAALHQRIKGTHMRIGFGVGANDVELVLRSLPSLRAALRSAGARRPRRSRAWWAGRPEVAQVLHPALEGSPGHEHWARLCSDAAGLFSIVFDARYSRAQVDAFVDALKLFRIGYSWAGPVSLAVPYDLATMRAQPRWAGTLVRFSLGLEAVEDLIEDCRQALAALAGELTPAGRGGARQRRRRRRIVSGSGDIVNESSSSGSPPPCACDARRSRSGRAGPPAPS